jgi:NADH:ubiquinone oxidoreductase subunit F (NADH-binding)/(2Fe-2S) ferredoxin/NAD-dependent dihydropyrimidine dehydrogenase PreA subunit
MANNDFIEKDKQTEAKRDLEGDRITIGLATCGISAGGVPVFEALEKANLGIKIMKTGCIGMCYAEPIVTTIIGGKKAIYSKVTKEKVELLIKAIKEKKECKELFMAHDITELDFYKKQLRLVTENCGIIDPARFDHYVYSGGFSGLKNTIKKKPSEIVDDIIKSGLRGRGGGGFPTGKKWKFISDVPGKKYLICNGDEGDPGAFMNRTLMESDPFRIIEGMIIGGYATGADEGIIYTRAEYPLAVETLQTSIDIAYTKNLLGKDILGIKGFNFDMKIQMGAGAFVCGEETALIFSIEGKRGQPRPRPPFPAISGLYGKPTVVNNVSTWGNVATIMKIGLDAYTKIGTEKSKGTNMICLTGKVKRSGVIEVPMGISLKEVVNDIGGGVPEGTTLKAVLSGGPAGGTIPADKLDTPLDYETLQALGTIMGSGGFIVLNNQSCIVNIAKFFMNFCQEESCGKCTPCREGTKRLLELLTKITNGSGSDADIEKIQELAEYVRDNALCGLGQNAPNPILSTLKYFRAEYTLHIKEKQCPAGACENLLKFFITQTCVGCGNCKRHCPVNAITGEPKKLHLIDQSKCIKCGKCYECCAFKSITKT